MKAATINEIKQELTATPAARLLELCIRLAKYKKDNKELLTYLLFGEQDEQGHIEAIKNEIDIQFGEMNQVNIYFAKKGVRKILRATSKYIRHIGSKQAEVELLIHFCKAFKGSAIPIKKSSALSNLYQSQLKKIQKVISTLHEDLQYDYLKEAGKLE